MAQEWNQITSVDHQLFATSIQILGVIQLNCLPDVSSYTALFASWQILDIDINLLI